jgi:hypothetical protein
LAEILSAQTCQTCGAVTRVIATGRGGIHCPNCLVKRIVDGYYEVIPEGFANCEACGEYGAQYCEGCASSECQNCGDAASYCSASCAISYDGYPEDYRPSCAYCGEDDAYYCSVRCAYRDNGETMCTNCDEEVCEARCPDCAEDEPLEAPAVARALTFTVVAAEPMAVIDDDSVSMDGITFDFDL